MSHRGILKEHSTLINFVFRIQDLLVAVASGWLSHYLYLSEIQLRDGYPEMIGVALLMTAWLFPGLSLYRNWRGTSFVDEVRVITLAWSAVIAGLLAFIFITKTGPSFSRGWLLLWAVVGWAGLVCVRGVTRLFLRWLRSQGFNLRHVVIVGENSIALEIADRLRAYPGSGLNVLGFFNVQPENADSRWPEELRLGALTELEPYVSARGVDQVWIALPLKDEALVKDILHELRHSTVDIRYAPDISSFRLLNHAVTEIAGLPVLDLSVSPMTGVNRVIKAVEDRLLATIILIVIAPLMLVLSLGVKLSSPGPVFYRQERVGWNGRPFMMLKFRSMPVDVEQHGVQWGGGKEKATTRFGAFIRRTSLDELPQFINVLKGDMSIVGPRPERTVFVEQFKDEVPGYMKKHLVKAGITGWAQVNGWRGDTDLNRRIEHDLYYIEHWSVWLDLKIIALTVFKGINSENAY